MKEMLCRGKQKNSDSWVEGYYIFRRDRYKGDKTFISERHFITTGIFETSGAYCETTKIEEFEVIPESISKFTGLTDKNGTKIFEGDILAYCDCYGVEHIEGFVEYGRFNCSCCEGVYGWYISQGCDGFYGDIRSLDKEHYGENKCGLFVKGNIHDNPELLRGITEQ